MLPLQRITVRQTRATLGSRMTALANSALPLVPGGASPDSEAAMVGVIQEGLEVLLQGTDLGWAIRREVQVGRAVADLVILLGESGTAARPRKPLSVSESVILSCVRNHGSRNDEQLAIRCGFSNPKAVHRPLRQLARHGWLSIDDDGQVSLAAQAQSSRLVAIEAKLTRWREALGQAEGYLRFADASYVILPIASIGSTLQNLESFRAAGVGLLLFVDGRQILELLPPKRKRTHDWQRAFVMSRLLSPTSH